MTVTLQYFNMDGTTTCITSDVTECCPTPPTGTGSARTGTGGSGSSVWHHIGTGTNCALNNIVILISTPIPAGSMLVLAVSSPSAYPSVVLNGTVVPVVCVGTGIYIYALYISTPTSGSITISGSPALLATADYLTNTIGVVINCSANSGSYPSSPPSLGAISGSVGQGHYGAFLINTGAVTFTWTSPYVQTADVKACGEELDAGVWIDDGVSLPPPSLTGAGSYSWDGVQGVFA